MSEEGRYSPAQVVMVCLVSTVREYHRVLCKQADYFAGLGADTQTTTLEVAAHGGCAIPGRLHELPECARLARGCVNVKSKVWPFGLFWTVEEKIVDVLRGYTRQRGEEGLVVHDEASEVILIILRCFYGAGKQVGTTMEITFEAG